MRFHVAREGAVVGEFEEQSFRNKVFAGEIMPNDFYWRAGFSDWRPVSEFRVARKTEVILLETAQTNPPAFKHPRTHFRTLAIIATTVILAVVAVALLITSRLG